MSSNNDSTDGYPDAGGTSNDSSSNSGTSQGENASEYTEEQLTDRAALNEALTDPANISLMQTMGDSSKERRKKN